MERTLELPNGRSVVITGDTPEQLRNNAAKVMQRFQQSQGQVQPPQPTQAQQAGPGQPAAPPAQPGLQGPPPGMPPMRPEPSGPPMSATEAFGRNVTQQGTLGFGDEIIGAVQGDQAAQEWNQKLKQAEKQHPYASMAGEFAGGFLPGGAITTGLRYTPYVKAVMSGGPIQNFLGSVTGGIAESVGSTIGGNETDGRFENLGSAALYGGLFGAGGHAAANLVLGGFKLGSNVIPWFRNRHKEEKAFRRIGESMEADGTDPTHFRKELGELGEGAVPADLPYPRMQGLTETVLESPKVPVGDFRTQLEARRATKAERASQLFKEGTERASKSVIDQARATGLTDLDIPGPNFDSLKKLSTDLRNRSDTTRTESYTIGVRPDETIITTTGKKIPRKGGPEPTAVYMPSGTDSLLEDNKFVLKASQAAIDRLVARHGKKGALIGSTTNTKNLYSLEYLDEVLKGLDDQINQIRPNHPDYQDLVNTRDKFKTDLLDNSRVRELQPTARPSTATNGGPTGAHRFAIPGTTYIARGPAATPGITQKYRDALAGQELADQLDHALDYGRKLATGRLPLDLGATSQEIAALTPMQRQAASVSFMDGLLRNVKSMGPNSDINAALRNTQGHKEIFDQLSGDPATTSIAFDNILDFAKREATFEQTARMTNMNPLELEKTKWERLRNTGTRMALIPTPANALTFGLNVMNSIADRKLNPVVARKIANIMFNKDISDDEWKLIQDGFSKAGTLTRFKQYLATTTASAAGAFGSTEPATP